MLSVKVCSGTIIMGEQTQRLMKQKIGPRDHLNCFDTGEKAIKRKIIILKNDQQPWTPYDKARSLNLSPVPYTKSNYKNDG